MTFINPNRHFPQKATYWEQKKQDGFGGESWEPPISISCRWEDMTSEELSVAYKTEGEIVLAASIVYTPTPLKSGGYLCKGETTEANPSRLPTAYVIRMTTDTPSIKNDCAEYVARL